MKRKKIRENVNTDYWGIWASRLSRKRHFLALIFWTAYSKINGFYWRISIGKGSCFWGKIIFSRIPGSSITIGRKCRFRSATWSNFIGINRPCVLSTLNSGAQITIGDYSGFSGTSISAAESITIGNEVICGANVTITDTDWHNIMPGKRTSGKILSAPIMIGDNVWLGLNVTVLKGVTIGNGTVIAANSTVSRDIPENVMAAGTPARIIKKIQA